MRHAATPVNPLFRFRNAARRRPIGGFCKRGFDIVGAVLALAFLSPLLLLLALLVKLSDGGCVLFGHRRVGRDGSSFVCLKYRTMAPNGDEILQAHLERNPQRRKEWIATRKLQDDPRVTRVGLVLRKLSLDELPQLLNILRGEMSFVGPRPVVEDELELYGQAVECYLKSRPGLTGLWQISGRNDVSYNARVAFDQQYVENWSFVFDMVIIIKTFPAVLSSRGSY